MATADYNGVQKAAILLITLGPERSADIFKHLKEEEIEELTLEIANTRSVSPQVKEDILNEFYQVCLAQPSIFINVDLPEPECPTMAINSPWLISRETSSSARTSFSPGL